MRLMPARSPKPACRVVPRIPMKMSGNAKSAMIRCRSRSSLMKSRCASARIAEASLTGLTHYFEVRVLEAGRMRLHDRERCFDRAKDRVDGVTVELELEGRTAARQVAESRELVAQARAIGGIDEHVVLDQIALDVVGRPERDDATLVEDANPVGLLGLLEIVRGQEDRGAARAADRARLANDVTPVDRRASAGRGKRGRQDRDGRRLARPIRPEQDEEFAGLDLERDAVDRVLLGLLVALHELFDADHRLSI